MDMRRVAAMAEEGKGGREMVFDWDKAATIIAEQGAAEAAAFLAGDRKSTWRPILAAGEPADSVVWLASDWGPPTLEIDGETTLPCWRWADETGWDGSTYWPASALAILHSSAAGGR